MSARNDAEDESAPTEQSPLLPRTAHDCNNHTDDSQIPGDSHPVVPILARPLSSTGSPELTSRLPVHPAAHMRDRRHEWRRNARGFLRRAHGTSLAVHEATLP